MVLPVIVQLFEWVQGPDQNQEDSECNSYVKALMHFALWWLPKVYHVDLRPHMKKLSIWFFKYVVILSSVSSLTI